MADAMAHRIESGYDNDGILQFKQIWVRLTQLNEHSMSELAEDEDVTARLSRDTLSLSTSVECSVVKCHYIADEDSAFDVDALRITYQIS